MHAVVTVFLVTYLLVATRRLAWLPVGRVAGALLGAAAMVAIGALTPAQSFAAIDHDTILLLFGMMLLMAYAERGGGCFRAECPARLRDEHDPDRELAVMGGHDSDANPARRERLDAAAVLEVIAALRAAPRGAVFVRSVLGRGMTLRVLRPALT